MPSTINFRADAPLIAQVSTVTITGYDAATTYSITINNKTISVVGTGGTTATTAAALQQALSASDFPEFKEIAFSVNSSTITMTANTAGRPFTATSGVSGGTGTIGSVTLVTANSGPSDMSVAANYTGGSLPSNGDTLVFENLENVSVLYGLDALSGIALASVIFRNCSGEFGLAQHNGQYWEYRNQYLEFDADSILFDCPNCQLARINSLAEQTAVTVKSTGSSRISNNLETLLWKGTHNSNVLNVDRGSVGVAVLAGEVATIATFNQGYIDNPNSDAQVRFGPGVTLGAVNRTGGLLQLNAGMSGNLVQREGASTLTLRGGGAYPSLVSHAGNIIYESSGTITNMTLGEDVIFDGRQNESTYTITNAIQAFKGAQFLDPMKKATWAGIKANGCKPHQIIVDRGPDCTVTAS